MGNKVNRRLDGPPVQGRTRECARRLRQRARRAEEEETERLVHALSGLSDKEVEAMLALGEADLAYVEDQVAQADLGVTTGVPERSMEDYARAILKAR